ncbi:MAG: tetratricopeptide repeat protein [Treponema sp.]|nr:tetratricopeptide repeat protein [Treponema sp.]
MKTPAPHSPFPIPHSPFLISPFLISPFPISLFTILIVTVSVTISSCASWGAATAEEYYSIGMAYYDMGRYADAEKWLNRAKAKDRTMSASEYNLGRIAFATGRYEEAIKHFESILKRDPNNVLALKAAAYTRIRNGDIEKAMALYERLLALVPESADDGYNYALVLYAMEKYAEAEQILKNHEFALLENNDVLLLYARTQKKQGKPEAIDNYAAWLAVNTDGKVRYEYAQVLEDNELYARALEEYRVAYTGLSATSVDPTKPQARFAIARVLLVADSEKTDGTTELRGAVADGFNDVDAIEGLLGDNRISAASKGEIRLIITEVNRAAEATRAAEEAERLAREAESGAEAETFVADDQGELPE